WPDASTRPTPCEAITASQGRTDRDSAPGGAVAARAVVRTAPAMGPVAAVQRPVGHRRDRLRVGFRLDLDQRVDADVRPLDPARAAVEPAEEVQLDALRVLQAQGRAAVGLLHLLDP